MKWQRLIETPPLPPYDEHIRNISNGERKKGAGFLLMRTLAVFLNANTRKLLLGFAARRQRKVENCIGKK